MKGGRVHQNIGSTCGRTKICLNGMGSKREREKKWSGILGCSLWEIARDTYLHSNLEIQKIIKKKKVKLLVEEIQIFFKWKMNIEIWIK